MISVEGLTVEFGGFTLFDDISFVVNKKVPYRFGGQERSGQIYNVENIRRPAIADFWNC